jgi:hypothetical protein
MKACAHGEKAAGETKACAHVEKAATESKGCCAHGGEKTAAGDKSCPRHAETKPETT